MLYVDIDMPEGALLEPLSSFQDEVRFSADEASLVLDGDVITGWKDVTGQKIARPAKPNTGNARLVAQGGQMAVALQDGVNCGFALEDVTLTQPVFSMAALYSAPTGRAGTLLTLNPRDGRNYLFLKEIGGEVALNYRDGDRSVSAKTKQQGLNLVVASVNGSAMRLAVNGGRPGATQAEAPLIPGVHDLFIGCRSDRSGITKTLGEANLIEIRMWPDCDVFEDEKLLESLTRHWQQVAAHGV